MYSVNGHVERRGAYQVNACVVADGRQRVYAEYQKDEHFEEPAIILVVLEIVDDLEQFKHIQELGIYFRK